MSQRFGIDVSHWQGDFDFARAKSNEDVEFAITRIANLRQIIKSVRHVDFQRERIFLEMQRA